MSSSSVFRNLESKWNENKYNGGKRIAEKWCARCFIKKERKIEILRKNFRIIKNLRFIKFEVFVVVKMWKCENPRNVTNFIIIVLLQNSKNFHRNFSLQFVEIYFYLVAFFSFFSFFWKYNLWMFLICFSFFFCHFKLQSNLSTISSGLLHKFLYFFSWDLFSNTWNLIIFFTSSFAFAPLFTSLYEPVYNWNEIFDPQK